MLNSFFGQMLVALQEHIKSEVPEIRWIDSDIGQLEYYETRPAVSFPAVLIDFPTTSYDQEGNQVQMGNATIVCRLAFAPFSASNNVAPDNVREQALKYYELEMKLYQALQGWYALHNDGRELCQPLTRTNAETEKREDPIRVRSLVFTTAFEDDTATPVKTKVPRPPLEFE